MKRIFLLLIAMIVAFSVPAAALDVNNEAELEEIVTRISDYIVENNDPTAYDWNWGENLLMRGLIRASEITGEDRYFNFVTDWLDVYCKGGGQYFPMEVDDVASAFSAILAFERTHDKKYLNCTKTAQRFLFKDSPRLEDGTIIHNSRGQLWLDTLYMINPFIAHLGRGRKDDEMLGLAADQILNNINRSEDEETHLSYHMWDPNGPNSPHFWARGNGWVVMAAVEVLTVLPEDHPKFKPLVELLDRRLTAINALQDESGLWHTILDYPDSYLEVSASAMYAYSILRGVHLGWLPEDMLPVALKALEAMAPFVEDSGRVVGVSAGTGPGDFDNYQNVPLGEYTWGTGSVTMAYSERIAMLREATE